jgi:DNA mismatch repair ATPase MutS
VPPIEIEVPDGLRFEKPPDFELSSKRVGYIRYSTSRLVELESQLVSAQSKVEEALRPFIKSIFKRFKAKKDKWRTILNCVAELDCLCSFALVVIGSEGQMCVP